MPTKRKYSNTMSPPIVYVVLQRTSNYLPHQDEHDVSCVSVHTSKVAANRAAEEFFDIDADDEEVDRESGWLSWEDLCGTRVQTNSEGLLRIIMTTDTREESLVWVEKKSVTVEEEEKDESGDVAETVGGEDDLEVDRRENSTKKRKVCRDTFPVFCLAQMYICRSAKLSTYPRINISSHSNE